MSDLNTQRHAGLTPEQLDAYWLPYSANRQFKADPRVIVGAEGSYYIDADGRRVFDGLSGLWCCGAGHNRPEIAEAVARQLRELDYAPAFQFGHPKAFELAERITQLTPKGLDHVFYTNSGSDAADTSLKIARAYWRKKGKPTKTKLIGRAKGYHGVNFGGISLGGIGANRMLFGQGIDADHLPHTLLKENLFSRGMPERGVERAEDLLELIALHDASNIAAVIVEPLAGSAGVLPPPVGYLQRLREICDQHEILLIFDEVITGFGRVGSNTGAEEFGVIPDMMNVAKQLTNGAVPMGAVIVQREIYQTFMEQGGPDYAIELPHGYTYSGHPVAAAVGLENLRILRDEHIVDYARNEAAPYLQDKIAALAEHPLVGQVRGAGMLGAFELVRDKASRERFPGKGAAGTLCRDLCIGNGLVMRAVGDSMIMSPPLIIQPEEIDELFEKAWRSLNMTAQELT